MFRLPIPILAWSLCLTAHADEQPSRAWSFDLKTPATYKVQVEYPSDLKASGDTIITYTIQIGKEAQSSQHYLVVGHPSIPLSVDLASPQKMRVTISGLSQAILKRTAVYAFDAATIPPGEYYDPRKHDFKELRQIRALLAQPPDMIDLGRAKLMIDKMIDPSIDVEGTLQKLDDMVATIKTLPEFGIASAAKLTAVQRYIYTSGSWNDYRPFQYDLDDPLGKKLSNQMLSSYIASRKGNCVTMPLLFIILGQRLGVEVTLSTAPGHFLAKFKTDDMGWINLEATSGATPAREVWIRGQFPSLTDQALDNGIYLQPLTKKESVAEVATILAEYNFHQNDYEKAMALADMVLEYYPKDVGMMTLKGSAFGRINHQHFPQNYISPAQLSANEMAYWQYLSQNSRTWFAKAEALGWREQTQAEQATYLQRVDKARQEKTIH